MGRQLGLIILLLPFLAVASVKKPPGYVVATASRYATEAGMAILQKGGNAFDAAVAISAVLAVTEPYHSGIGGGGFWLLHDAKNNKNIFIDGREVAPLSASRDMYLDHYKRPIKNLSLVGPLASAIPGEVAALDYIATHYGTLSLAQDLNDAIHLADEGFKVDSLYRKVTSIPFILENLRADRLAAEIFLNHGEVPAIGHVIKQKALSKTLAAIAKRGSKAFYQGPIAERMVAAVRKGGGIWQLEDLKDYRLSIRKPLVGEYKGIRIITAPPPSAGGIALLTMLKILQSYPLNNFSYLQKVHHILESMRLAYWDRARFLGDSDFVKVPVAELLSEKHIKTLKKYIRPQRATPSSMLGRTPRAFAELSVNTTHFSVIDKMGNMVSATMSINYLFGSGFVAGNTGVLLNNEMDDFSVKPGVKNIFGLVGSEKNAIAPKKRPLSSMSPTFLMTDSRVAVIGTPGGSRIPTMLLISTLAFADGKHPVTMVSVPRFHHQYLPDVVTYENDAFDKRLQHKLREMGYRIQSLSKDYQGRTYVYGDMQIVEWDKRSNALFGASDPRKVGLSSVFYVDEAPQSVVKTKERRDVKAKRTEEKKER